MGSVVDPSKACPSADLSDRQLFFMPAEERFERITRTAQRLFEIPIAMIAVVDHGHQWCRSMQNTAEESLHIEEFCQSALQYQDTMVVSDTLADERFCDHPLVKGPPCIRFYAAQPLRSADGDRIGTLGIMDCRPRSFRFSNLQVLKDLACWAENELRMAIASETQQGMIHEMQHLRQLSLLDPMLKTWNREGIDEILRRELKSTGKGSDVGLLMLDIDHFKRVNDTFGHPAGDQVLREVASAIRSSVRPTDAVGRYGGEEFLIVLPACPVDELRVVAERIRRNIADMPVTYGANVIQITVSLGAMCLTRGNQITIQQSIPQVDHALYRAKAAGRNQVVFHEAQAA